MQLKMCDRLLSDEDSIYVIWSIFWPQMLLFPHHPWEPRILFSSLISNACRLSYIIMGTLSGLCLSNYCEMPFIMCFLPHLSKKPVSISTFKEV